MVFRSKAALLFSAALLAAAPAANLALTSPAYAQAGATEVQAMINSATADIALPPGATPAQVAAATSSATQAAVAQAIKGGASGAALAAGVKAVALAGGGVNAALVAQGMAQAAAQIAADSTATPAMKAAALAMVNILAADAAFNAAVAKAGGLKVSAIGGDGGPTLLTDLASVLTGIAGGTVTIVTVPPTFDPCDNVRGDYC